MAAVGADGVMFLFLQIFAVMLSACKQLLGLE